MSDADERRASEVEGTLLRARLVEVLDIDDDDATHRWAGCDIASMVEGAFQRQLDPWVSLQQEREAWLARLGESYEPPVFVRDFNYTRFLWVLDPNGQRVGTLALPVSSVGQNELHLWSVYVHPAHRRRGLTTRTLRACYDAALAAGFSGVRLCTHWAWQRSLRFYAERRMWVLGWQGAIDLGWQPALPHYEIVESSERLVLAVASGGRMQPWFSAAKRGELLVLEEDRTLSHSINPVFGHATMAIALALRGWPLVRSQEHWQRRHENADVATVEGLASKIQLFEAIARHNEWILQTPRIPGLAYPPLDAL